MSANDIEFGMNVMWALLNTSLIVFMQAGLAAFEVGSIRRINAEGVLYKNLVIGAITVICWWILGYGFAAGATKGGFVGVSFYGLHGHEFENNRLQAQNFLDFQYFFYYWALASLVVTIASSSVSERCKKPAYLISAACIAVWIFPIIVHWCWGEGWLSAFGPHTHKYLFYGVHSNNYIDGAGSGVVFAVAGVCALVGAIAVGPRKGRFDGVVFERNNINLVVVAVMILWFGWYGFNMIASHGIVGTRASIAGKIAAVTTLSAGFSTVTMMIVQALTNNWDMHQLGSSLLAGLVGVSASCTVIEPWAAMCLGIGTCIVYQIASKALVALKIDDAVDAFPIFGACGIWGALAVGIFGSDRNAAFYGYQGSATSNNPFRTGEQFGVQFCAILSIVAWTAGWAALVWFVMAFTIGVRDEEEKDGKEVKKEVELA